VAFLKHKDFLILFGKNLKRIRIEKGMSQEDIAFNSKISVNQIGRIERAEINTGLSTIFELAKTMKVEIKELFDFKEK
jgi:transcriptional regulator with XRE-family HTH domain